MSSRITTIAMLATLLWLGAAAANEIHPNMDARAIVAQQQRIRDDVLRHGGPYKDLPAADREALLKEQDKVFQLLDRRDAVTDLPEPERIVVFNALESIEGIVNRAQDERMVCERVRRVGSNRSETVCMTAGERRARREADAKELGTRNAGCIRQGEGCASGW
ncbi:MAG TPA: hypothetical protein VGD42_11860 [Lysobacter sp.]